MSVGLRAASSSRMLGRVEPLPVQATVARTRQIDRRGERFMGFAGSCLKAVVRDGWSEVGSDFIVQRRSRWASSANAQPALLPRGDATACSESQGLRRMGDLIVPDEGARVASGRALVEGAAPDVLSPQAMSLECAHCGTRCPDGSPRCPKCLRSTNLLVVVDAPPPRSHRRRWALAVGALVLVLGGGGAWQTLRSRRALERVRPIPMEVPPQANDPLVAGAELQEALVRVRAEHDPVGRARRAAEMVHQRRQAALVGEGEAVPAPRSPDLIWRVLPSARERVSTLDLARLVATLLRAAGDPAVTVAERTAPARPDEPVDPTGMLGTFVVRAGDHVVEVAEGTLTAHGSVAHQALDPAALAGAIAAQSALELATNRGPRDRALQYANAAVEAWSTSPTPLLARARVWIEVGGSSGLDLADSDLRAAIALRDDPAAHLARARVLLATDRLAEAATESLRAARMAPAWGSAGLAMIALGPVLARLDASAPNGCDGLRRGRAPWTDDAYALCASDVPDDARRSAATRLLAGSDDPLRAAYAVRSLGADAARSVHGRLRMGSQREAARWLMLLGHGELAALVLGDVDGGL